MTSWVMGLRNSLLRIDLGLELCGLSICLLLLWMTFLRFAMDLEHPDLPPPPPPPDLFLVKILLNRIWGLDQILPLVAAPNWISHFVISPTCFVASGAGKILSISLDLDSSPTFERSSSSFTTSSPNSS
ncbi:hypothetical protein RIF29_28948 [Crotalaria pallida]|uniref:Uncharacterized protein n=1 Tax=Crotalaria pallida TaxID=3830 RepID=A0AAN9HX05_CROPI